MILVDPPVWPAHGTTFSHLVSDESLAELHAFARAAGIPERAFDHDHYDVPARMHGELVARGAMPVPASQLIRRLLASGLRVRTPERTPKRIHALTTLARSWQALMSEHESLGAELVERWMQDHRHYHDVRHLHQVLVSLDRLEQATPDARVDARAVRLAAWFHDAVYDGRPDDEEQSAQLAADQLGPLLPAAEVEEVVRLVLLTEGHDPHPDDVAGAHLVDADLSILGTHPGRYDVYVRDVRLDFEHVDDAQWRVGRVQVLDHLMGLDPLFRTELGRTEWAPRARTNLAAERARWLAG